MISKTIIFATIVCATFALHMDFEEDGGMHTEGIVVTKDTVEYDVPQHGEIAAAKYLSDFASGYTAMKVAVDETCYIMDLPKDAPKPQNVVVAVHKVNETFPQRYWVEKNNLMQLRNMELVELSVALQNFCGSYKAIKVAIVKNVDEMEKIALQIARAQASRQQNKRVVIEKFPVCSNVFTAFNECHDDNTKTLKAECRVRTRSCVYRVTCDYQGSALNCASVHDLSSIHCCDYVCV